MTNQNDVKTEPALVAAKIGELMYSIDRVGRRIGIRIDEVAPGYARVKMEVTPEMINGHEICHGSYIFAVADTACAYACNSHNRKTLSQAVNLVFLAPAAAGETLIAEAVMSGREGRTSVYEVRVKTDRDRAIAVFQSQCREVSGRILEEYPEAAAG